MKTLKILLFAGALLLVGCAGTDPFTIQSIETLRDDHTAIMDDYDRLAEDTGKPKLDPDFRADEIEAYNALLEHLDPERGGDDE